jgi:hypothetical protein
LAGADDATSAWVERKFGVQDDLSTSTSREDRFIEVAYAFGEKIGKEGEMESGAEGRDGQELNPEAELACTEQLLFERMTLDGDDESEW